MKAIYFIFLLFPIGLNAFCQTDDLVLNGEVVDKMKLPIQNVSVQVEGMPIGTITDTVGKFSLKINQEYFDKYLILRHIQYEEKKVLLSSLLDPINPQKVFITIELQDSLRILDQVNVTDKKLDDINTPASTFELNPINSKFAPSPFQDISSLLITLPGVTSRNEFSTGYSVRGGNYDENLVYVNNIPVYRPQIVTSGEQEGLSFINTDLVQGIEFSSGGWESKYGDGLASTLNVKYKTPEKFAGSIDISLLGGAAHVEGISKNGRISYLLGSRLKSSTYLLNTLETDGEYRPRFTDVQAYVNYDISKEKEKGKTEIGVLFSYARNKYLVQPTNRETTFGTFNNQLRLYVAFDGQEKLTYDTWQSGITMSHRISKRWLSHLIFSGTYSREREYYDIESGYLLCNVDNNPSSTGFNKCLTNIGIGTNYYSGRNLLDATLLNIEERNEVIINANNTMEFGFGYSYHDFDDVLNEYEFTDSVDYVTITDAVNSKSQISYSRIQAYWQNTTSINSNQSLTYGIRGLFQDFNNDLLISPRIQYSLRPMQLRNTYLRASVGLYQQPPLYREFRNNEGELNDQVKAQSSMHSIVGMDVGFSKWGRPFKFTTEMYYKYLWNVNPYDIENVRIRYYAENIAKAYAAGIDFRLSGEFIPGQESWFSLGLLSTKEDIKTDNRGYIPRPTDQMVNFGIFFQDHIPNNPSFQVHLRLLFSTGLPFSPPNNPEYRNSFRGSDYQRVDIGFSKIFTFDLQNKNSFFKSLWLSAEILNLTGHQNTISYYWVNDVNNNFYAVPNSLSQRFFNLRVSLKF